MKKSTLLELKVSRKARILAVSGNEKLISRLMSLGFYPGREITKVGHIGLHGAVTIKIGRTVMALGHGMAGKIIVESE